MNESFEDQVTDAAAHLFCLGQDWQKGDGGAFQVDEIADKLLAAHRRDTARAVREALEALKRTDILAGLPAEATVVLVEDIDAAIEATS